MNQEQRRVIVSFNDDGTPNYRLIRAYSQDEMNVKIVKAFIESGRIKEIIPWFPLEQQTNQQVLVKDYAMEWLGRKRRLKENTRATYLKYLNQYIIPDLGDKIITTVKVKDVQEMLDKHDNLARKTLTEMKSTLSQIFKYAVSDEIIRKNPCESVDIVIPSNKKAERKALPLAQFQEILSNLVSLTGDDKRFLALCLFTAMRRGEVLGLRWEDIFAGKIHVKRNVTHPQRNQPTITTPKTKAGIRSIPLSEPLAKTLYPFEKEGFVIGGEKPYTLSKFRAMWKRIRETIDLHGATPHILRHSYLTYAVGATTDFKTIQGISGHSDVFTLMNRYAHPQEDKVIELTNEIAEVLTHNVTE